MSISGHENEWTKVSLLYPGMLSYTQMLVKLKGLLFRAGDMVNVVSLGRNVTGTIWLCESRLQTQEPTNCLMAEWPGHCLSWVTNRQITKILERCSQGKLRRETGKKHGFEVNWDIYRHFKEQWLDLSDIYTTQTWDLQPAAWRRQRRKSSHLRTSRPFVLSPTPAPCHTCPYHV